MRTGSRTLVVVALIGLIVALFTGCATVEKVRQTVDTVGGGMETYEEGREVTTPVRIDTYEPNDDLLHPTTIRMNSTTKATIEPAGDVDVFKVHVASNKREVVKVTFLNPSRNLWPRFRFFDQNREEIGLSEDCQQGAAQASGQFIAQPNQDYYIEVCSGWYGDPDEERSGEYYSLDVKLASVSDDYEPNESLMEAAEIPVGEIKGTINPAGDVDYYKVHIAGGGTVKVTFVNPTLNLWPRLRFFDQNREEIGLSEDCQQGAAQAFGQFTAQPNQDYYIEVCSGWYGDPDEESSTEFYTLKIEMVR